MKKLFLLLSLTLAAGACCRAQIVYHGINPDTTVAGASGFFSLKPVPNDPEIVINYYPSPASIYAEQHGSAAMLYRDGFPAKLNANDSIGPVSDSWTPAALSLSSGGNGNWQSDATDKYLAFRFKIASAWHYGWLKMTVAAGAASFTVKEWAYQSEAGKYILAGQKAGTTGIENRQAGNKVQLAMHHKHIRFSNLDATGNYRVRITGMDGRCMVQTNIKADDAIDMTAFPPGIYAATVYDKEHLYPFKILLP